MFNREIIYQEIADLDLVCDDDAEVDAIISDATDIIFADEYLASQVTDAIDEAIFAQNLPSNDDEDF